MEKLILTRLSTGPGRYTICDRKTIPMQTRIQGTTMPVLDVQLEPNESVLIESGELSWMTASIQMTNYTLLGGVVGSMLGGDK
jgi:uncharacterized protein (AIM24 family)